MKRLTEESKKVNIWKWLAAGSVALVVALSVVCSLFMYWNIEGEEETDSGEVLKAETVAVLSEEKKGTRTFLNQPAPAAEAGDNREVFRIIEVIPHEACSVFPYFVDWKTEKGYDLNTPLGYDGIMLSAQIGSYGNGSYGSGMNLFSLEDTLAKDSRPFTYVEEKFVKEYFENLSDYDRDFYSVNDVNRGGNWFRKTKDENDLTQESYGYFEYVGAGKGLYYVNTSLVAGTRDSNGNLVNNGIHFEIQAVPRKGTEDPKGYMDVCDPAYYWSKYNGETTAKPVYEGNAIKGLTDYNYDLKFFTDASNGKYIVNNVVYSAVAGDECAYDLKINPSEVAGWDKGFYYQKNGFYEVESCVEDPNGKYIRYADSEKDDGFIPESPGYFMLKEEGRYEGVKQYNVVFHEAVSGNGSYMAKAPDTFTGDKVSFIYRGKGKGSYRVTFLYAPDNSSDVKYACEITEVSTGQGSYALATTSTDGDGKAKYEESASGHGDYAEVITYIDARTGGKYGDGIDNQYNRYGVTSGDTWSGNEVGGWVFVPLESAEDMEQTFLKDVVTNADGKNSNTDAYFELGDKIYVAGQKRIYRFYGRDGLQNNEWFKLLCYSNNPEDDSRPYSDVINGVGYDFNKTVKDNLNNDITQQLIEAFDGQFRIEIIQKEPQYLTVDDVKSADLIYISNQEGINGMSLQWNAVSNKLTDETLPECNWNTCCKLTEEQDISTDVLLALYDECIYRRNRALIVAHSVTKEDGDDEKTWPITRNLTKLYHMMNFFDEALNWAYFMPEQYPNVAKDEFSKIRTNDGYATVDVYIDSSGSYNITFPSGEDTSLETSQEGASQEENLELSSSNPAYGLRIWDKPYFQVWSDPYTKSTPVTGFSFHNDIGDLANTVQDGETKLTVKYYLDPMFMDATTKSNVWKILRNRQLDSSMLVVEVTNGEVTGETVPRRVIYADEFDPQSFDIKYKVLLLGSSRYPSALTDITLTFEDGSVAGKGSILQYGEENTNNVRHGFTIDGSSSGDLNPSKTVRKVTITATDSNGKTASAEVYVIVREAFMLN